jgi:negative regulator of replication initiation
MSSFVSLVPIHKMLYRIGEEYYSGILNNTQNIGESAGEELKKGYI